MADPIDPRVDIGHIHLKVADLDRALAFYHGVLGFEVTARMGRRGLPQRRRLSPSHRAQHLGEPQRRAAGGGDDGALSRGDPLSRSRRAGRGASPPRRRAVPLDGASDHGVSEALYLRDPDGNGLELYWDRPKEQWPRGADGSIQMTTERARRRRAARGRAPPEARGRRRRAESAPISAGTRARLARAAHRACSRCTRRCWTMRRWRMKWIAAGFRPPAPCCSW